MVIITVLWLVLATFPFLAIPLIIWQRKSTTGRVIGILMILLGSFPLYGLTQYWPPDFITGGGYKLLVDRDIGGYQVELETDHGGDPYGTWLEITAPDGRIALYLVYNDGPKWWWCDVVQENDRYYFVRSFDGMDEHTIWFDPVLRRVGGTFDGGPYSIPTEGVPIEEQFE